MNKKVNQRKRNGSVFSDKIIVMKKLISKLAILVVMVTNLPFSGLSALALTERSPDQAAIGIISESAAKSTKVSNIFGVLSSQARRTKQRIFSVLDSDIDMNKLGRVLSENGGNKTAFFENLSLLDNVNIKRIVKDEKLMKRMIKDTGFYKKFEISEVQNSQVVNDIFVDDGRFSPYKNNSLVLTMRTSEQVNGEFVRFYREDLGNKVSSWTMRKTDVVDERGALLPIVVIQSKFAIPGVAPTHLVDVNLPANVDIRYSIAKAQPQLGLEGGGEQFEITSDLSADWFDYERLLNEF